MKKSEIITIFLIVFVFNAFLCVLTLDDVWNFGFSYNIASGLIPYRDFNMVITPFFPMLMAFFLSLFSKHIVIMYIVNSVIVVSIIYLIKKVCKDSYYLLFILILPLSTINYSLFCLFLLLLILYCEMNNKSDYLIGFLLAITILTKQHVGLALLIPSILIFKKECLLKRFIGFIIPILTFILYLISTNSLRPFIDYTVLGLFDFANTNTLIAPTMIIEILIIIFLIYKVLTNKKDVFLLYIICFQIITYPIFDIYHFMLGFIPVLIYILKDIKLNIKITKMSSIIIIIIMLIYNIIKLDFNQISFTNSIRTMDYRVIDKTIIKEVNQISHYIKENNINNLYLFNSWSYLIKLDSNIKINRYDLINNGNLGYKGTDKILNTIKTSPTGTTFILIEAELTTPGQINKTILNYVYNNITKVDEIGIFSIYQK